MVGLTDDDVEALCEDTPFFRRSFFFAGFWQWRKIVMSLNEQWTKNTMLVTKWRAKMSKEGEGWAPTSSWFFWGKQRIFLGKGRSFLIGTRPLNMCFSTNPNKKRTAKKKIGVICLVLVILVGGYLSYWYYLCWSLANKKVPGSFSDDLVKICLLNSFWLNSLSRCCRGLLPGSLTVRPGKMMVGRLLSFWYGNFSGANC